MKSAHSCRVCSRYLEGDLNRATSEEERSSLMRQMGQGHCDDCPPTINFMGSMGVGALLGLSARTVSAYLTQSKMPGGRYVDHPFPVPDGHWRGAPYWFTVRAPEIREWAQTRAGQGAGGGRKKKNLDPPGSGG